MKKKKIVVFSIIIGSLILVTLTTACITNFIQSADFKSIDSAIATLNEDYPTHIYYTGNKKMKGVFLPRQSKEIKFDYVVDDYSFDRENGYFYTALVFNEIDFSLESNEKYFRNFHFAENLKIYYVFYNCNNVDIFIDDILNMKIYDFGHDLIPEIEKLYSIVPLNENSAKRIKYNENLSKKKYARNDIVKMIDLSILLLHQ